MTDHIPLVERMLKKPMVITSKRELANLILAQYAAIDTLLGTIGSLDPNHPILAKIAKVDANVKDSRFHRFLKRLRWLISKPTPQSSDNNI